MPGAHSSTLYDGAQEGILIPGNVNDLSDSAKLAWSLDTGAYLMEPRNLGSTKFGELGFYIASPKWDDPEEVSQLWTKASQTLAQLPILDFRPLQLQPFLSLDRILQGTPGGLFAEQANQVVHLGDVATVAGGVAGAVTSIAGTYAVIQSVATQLGLTLPSIGSILGTITSSAGAVGAAAGGNVVGAISQGLSVAGQAAGASAPAEVGAAVGAAAGAMVGASSAAAMVVTTAFLVALLVAPHRDSLDVPGLPVLGRKKTSVRLWRGLAPIPNVSNPVAWTMISGPDPGDVDASTFGAKFPGMKPARADLVDAWTWFAGLVKLVPQTVYNWDFTYDVAWVLNASEQQIQAFRALRAAGASVSDALRQTVGDDRATAHAESESAALSTLLDKSPGSMLADVYARNGQERGDAIRFYLAARAGLSNADLIRFGRATSSLVSAAKSHGLAIVPPQHASGATVTAAKAAGLMRAPPKRPIGPASVRSLSTPALEVAKTGTAGLLLAAAGAALAPSGSRVLGAALGFASGVVLRTFVT